MQDLSLSEAKLPLKLQTKGWHSVACFTFPLQGNRLRLPIFFSNERTAVIDIHCYATETPLLFNHAAWFLTKDLLLRHGDLNGGILHHKSILRVVPKSV